MSDSAFSNDEREDPSEGKVIASLEPHMLDPATTALVAAGYPPDQIEVITAEDVDGVETPLDQTGFRGLVSRFFLSLGGGLNRLEVAREELAAGRVLVMIAVQDDDEMFRVSDMLRSHGSHRVFYAGRWTITVLS